jgi:putative addiction module component (TIGR02574 family)
MSGSAEKVLAEAMKLTAEERARIAAELIASVDGEPDADASRAWAAEIDRRVQRVREQGATGEEWRTVHERIADRLRSK